MDFTLEKYVELLQVLKADGYRFITFEQFCLGETIAEDAKFVILRHDVDLKAENALATARIEHALGTQASYFFRVVKQSNKPEIIKGIISFGHEIGYHYEDMTICEGNAEKAIEHFNKQLEYFRQFYPVRTICMHGSPRSKYDSRDLWKQYDYRDYGVIGEPYFDVDFSKVFYLTDTGRCWDGFNVSVRDKIPFYQDQWMENGWTYHTTNDIIEATKRGTLPRRLMMTTHPQRWTNDKGAWLMEAVMQSVKNMVKRIMVRNRG